ncbi:MAG: glycosyl transferase family 90 [Methylococcales bacterium]|nr:glycosyl transferase family 90 [Methylococcales bacterium]
MSNFIEYFPLFASEFIYWKSRNLQPHNVVTRLHELSETYTFFYLIKIQDGYVSLVEKNNAGKLAAMRIEFYLDFFRKVIHKMQIHQNMIFGICVADREIKDCNVPTFSFQKDIFENGFLLPDIDFLDLDFYKDNRFNFDEKEFCQKKNSAIFVGSTTGAPYLDGVGRFYDKDTIIKGLIPRVNSALYFKESEIVNFYLPSIVQSKDNEARDYLKNLGFGDDIRISYQDQFKHKFIISMDGNGATCSRVALTLKHKSILLKYDSDSILFYFKKLVPFYHYIPIKQNCDIENIVTIENNHELFSYIIKNANDFYEKNLTENALIEYTGSLLYFYATYLFNSDKKFD